MFKLFFYSVFGLFALVSLGLVPSDEKVDLSVLETHLKTAISDEKTVNSQKVKNTHPQTFTERVSRRKNEQGAVDAAPVRLIKAL